MDVDICSLPAASIKSNCQKKSMQVGKAISYGNTGDRVTVQLKDKTVEAIAVNEINSSKVMVVVLLLSVDR